jgi:hypothetical protein
MDLGAARVEGYHEILALHRLLFECKREDVSNEYAGSPNLAAIQNRLADAVIHLASRYLRHGRR